jgi:gentisate 1,2-dioxygenase
MHNLRALWHNEMRPLTGLPDTVCIPHLWPYKEQRDVVLRERSSKTKEKARC